MGSLLGTSDRTRGSGQEHAESGAKPQTTIKTTTGCKVVNRRSGQSETESIVDPGRCGQKRNLQGGFLSGVRAGIRLAGANRRLAGERAMADVKVRGSRRRCQASDDVYGEQIEHERKETDEFLRSPMSPLLLAGTITFEHHGVACESATACGNSLPQGERLVFEAGSEITVTVNGEPAPQLIFQTEGDGSTESYGPCEVRRLHSTPGEAKVRRLRSFVNLPGGRRARDGRRERRTE